MASPRCQFVGAVCIFMLVLGIMVFVSVVLQDGTVIVPFAILLLIAIALVYKCVHGRTNKNDDELDDVATAVQTNAKNRKSMEANNALRLSNSQRLSYNDNNTMALPPGWTKEMDDASGNNFYYNEATGETTWEHPGTTQTY